MIKGLYEAHLPVSDLVRSIDFYKNLNLELAFQKGKVAFFWIEKGRNWRVSRLFYDLEGDFQFL
jgi:catechol 2,3-dioxygenase-like lactoylglutathione lyase family enzyme